MSRLEDFFCSSIGRKAMVALAGLLLCGFLVAHLGGNLFLLQGEGPFNHYAEVLEANPLLIFAELGLLFLFVVHIVTTLRLTWKNRFEARPVKYEAVQSKGGRSPGSRTMAVSGLVLLFFLIVHLKSFRFTEDKDGLYLLVANSFTQPIVMVFYVVSMVFLGFHLSHGFQSAFQTLGLSHPKYTPLVKKAGLAFSILIPAGFALLPVYIFFHGARP